MEREKFGSRLGFILISAGCAIGLGNVWRFPYITGVYGGAAFVLLYLFFLLILGLPIMVMEFAVGRGSQKSAALSFDVLEPKGTKWHWYKWGAMAGNYLLMMFYTTIGGWMLLYFFKMAAGQFEGMNAEQVQGAFAELTGNPGLMAVFMILVVLVGFGICARGLQNGVEKVTKVMMLCLLALMVVLAVRAVMLPGGEAVSVTVLDTMVALMAGLIIFPACFAYGVQPDSGPSLIFITLPNVFNAMAGGRLWGTLFFLFMSFAALSTIIAVFENIISFAMDLTGCSRKKAVICNLIAIIVLSMPCVLGFNLLSGFTPFGEGSNVLDLEDFIVSSNLLPLGSLIYLLFCTSKYGWGYEKFLEEANTGKGVKFPKWIRGYVKYVLPLIVIGIFVMGYYTKFAG